MSDQEHTESINVENNQAGSELSLDLNFVPEWARKPADANYFNYKPREDRRDRGSRRRNDQGSDRRPGPRPKPGDRKPRQKSSGDSRSKYQSQRPPQRERVEKVELPPVSIRFLPLQKAISLIVRKIKSSGRVHPLMTTSSLFLSNPESVNARIEVNKDSKDVKLLQCKMCGMIDLKEEGLLRHMVNKHLDEFMDKEQLEGEAPRGSFPCVAQCGLSGVLLGPPNHHSYAEKIQEIHRHAYSNMSLEDYKSRIKTVHDEESVEKWKQEYANRSTYRIKGNEDDKPMTLAKAESYFLKNIAPEHIQETNRATLPVPLTRFIGDRGLLMAVKNEWMKEQRFPASIMMALRGAFISKGLFLFKAGGKKKKVTFVSTRKHFPIELEYVVDAIKEVLLHLQAHPGSSRSEMVKVLRPDAEKDSEQVKEILSPLSWLIDRGHIIEFFDGTLAVPMQKKK